MNAHSNGVLSDNELDAVSGGERHVVSKDQYDILLEIRMMGARDGGRSEVVDAWLKSLK
jgi:bacteriocin-like protein